MKRINYILIALCSTLIYCKSKAQDVTAFSQKENYNIHGGLQLGTNFYQAIEGPQRYAPLGFMANGNIQLQLGAVNVPLSFTYNNLQGSLSKPFQQYGASPYYKWIKLHLGYRSLNFSPYVYSGRTFNGVGIELTPGIWNFTAFRGKLRNFFAIQDTVVSGALVLPTFDRTIQGAKVGIGKRNKFELSAVKVKDDAGSSPNAILNPQDNLVLGAGFNFRFFKSIQLTLNTASSIFTNNTNATIPEDLQKELLRYENIHQVNATSRISFAGDAGITYNKKQFSLGLKYKRVNPYYYSLATNFIQNDIENYTVNTSIGLLKRKLRLRGSLGIQKDNLSNQKAFTSNRIIGSATAIYIPKKELNMMFRYSNYQHENSSGLAIINDTVKILTTTNTLMFNTNFKYYSTEQLSTSFNINVFNNYQIDESPTSDRGFNGLGINVSLPIEFTPKELTISPSFFYNKYTFSTFSQGRVGGGFTVSKSFLEKKITTSFTTLISQNQYDGKGNGNLINGSISGSYKINKNNSFLLRLYYFDNQTLLTNSSKEFRGNVSYGVRF